MGHPRPDPPARRSIPSLVGPAGFRRAHMWDPAPAARRPRPRERM